MGLNIVQTAIILRNFAFFGNLLCLNVGEGVELAGGGYFSRLSKSEGVAIK